MTTNHTYFIQFLLNVICVINDTESTLPQRPANYLSVQLPTRTIITLYYVFSSLAEHKRLNRSCKLFQRITVYINVFKYLKALVRSAPQPIARVLAPCLGGPGPIPGPSQTKDFKLAVEDPLPHARHIKGSSTQTNPG